MPKGNKKKGNGEGFVPCLLLLLPALWLPQRRAGLSPRLSTSLRAGKENKATAKLADTFAKPINRSS